MAAVTQETVRPAPLDALEAIRTRRAIKEYEDTPVPRELVEELLDAAHWAPNHHLTHPWRFYVFTGEGRERLVPAREAAMRYAAERRGEPVSAESLQFARAKCYSAPVVVIVATVTTPDDPIKDREDYAACWTAVENLLIAATARGLGSYPSTGDWDHEGFVASACELPENERPVACIFIGHSHQETMAKRLPVERHTHWFQG